MMDLQMIINISVGALLTVIGWLAHQLWEAVKELRENLHDIELEIPHNYVRRDEFFENMREIKEMLSKIFDRLDSKVDKH